MGDKEPIELDSVEISARLNRDWTPIEHGEDELRYEAALPNGRKAHLRICQFRGDMPNRECSIIYLEDDWQNGVVIPRAEINGHNPLNGISFTAKPIKQD